MKTIEERKAIAEKFVKDLTEKTNSKVTQNAKIWSKNNNVRVYGIDDRYGFINVTEEGKIENKLNGAKSIWGKITEIINA